LRFLRLLAATLEFCILLPKSEIRNKSKNQTSNAINHFAREFWTFLVQPFDFVSDFGA